MILLFQAINHSVVLVAFWFFGQLLDLKPRKKSTVIITYIAVYAICITTGLLRYIPFFTQSMLPYMSLTVVYFVVQLASMFFLYKAKTIMILFIFFVNKIIECAALSVTDYLISFLPEQDIINYTTAQSHQSLNIIILYIICIAIVFILEYLVVLFSKYWSKSKNQIVERVFLLLIPASQFCLFFQSLFITATSETAYLRYGNAWLLVGTIFAVVGDLSLLYTLERMRKRAIADKKISLMENQMAQNMEDLKGIEAISKRQYMISHDLKNQLLMFGLLMEKNDVEEASKQIKEISETIRKFDEKEYCSNTIINSIINYKSYIAANKEINIDVEANVGADIPISNSDLCSLISNILDNSINAVEKLPRETDRTIKLICVEKAGLLLISESNNYIKKDHVEIADDGQIHGLGLEIISHITNMIHSPKTERATLRWNCLRVKP